MDNSTKAIAQKIIAELDSIKRLIIDAVPIPHQDKISPQHDDSNPNDKDSKPSPKITNRLRYL